jgi:hypothetical protein
VLAEALHYGGSKEREHLDLAYDEGGEPSKASSAKVNLARGFMGGYGCRFCPKF